MEAFRITRKAFAQFTLGESIMEWALPCNDAAYMAEEGYVHRGDGGWAQDELHGEIVPLWELVYHDAQLAIRDAAFHVNTKMDTDDPLVRYLRVYLKTLRAGTLPPSFFGDDLTLQVLKGYQTASTAGAALGAWGELDAPGLVAMVSRLSARLSDEVFYSQMTEHAFVGGDLFHERTRFEGKYGPVTVRVNTALEAWEVEPGVVLAPLGFWIEAGRFEAYHALAAGGETFGRPTLRLVEKR